MSHQTLSYLLPVAIGLLYVLLMCLVPEPNRRRLNAVMVGGAGAAYLSGGGLGGWEFAFTALVTYVAYRGLDSCCPGCVCRAREAAA